MQTYPSLDKVPLPGLADTKETDLRNDVADIEAIVNGDRELEQSVEQVWEESTSSAFSDK